MRAEADQPDARHQRQAEHGRARHAAPARVRVGAEHEERQHDSCRDLDPRRLPPASARRARSRGDAPAVSASAPARHASTQRVVVSAADGQLQQHRVQPDKRRGQARRAPERGGRAARSARRGEGGGDRDRLQRPQPAREPQRRRGVAREREQRAVGRVLSRPADERIDRVGGSFKRRRAYTDRGRAARPCGRTRGSRTRPGRSAAGPSSRIRLAATIAAAMLRGDSVRDAASTTT